MRFFFICFAIITAVCGYFWYTDGPGSGMDIATYIAAGIALAVGGYNWYANGSALAESRPKS